MWIVRYAREFADYALRIVRIGWEFFYNLPTLLRVPRPTVTVFGSGVLEPTSPYGKKAYDFGRLCALHGIAVITGGGPAIMYAANCGAASVEQEQGKKVTKSLGIGVRGIDDHFRCPHIPFIRFHYFFMRKWFLMRFASAIVVFPGGIGTLDELFDTLNLRKHNMLPEMPIVFVGTDYWMPLVIWLKEYAVGLGVVKKEVLELFTVTDDINEAFNLVHACCKQAPVLE